MGLGATVVSDSRFTALATACVISLLGEPSTVFAQANIDGENHYRGPSPTRGRRCGPRLSRPCTGGSHAGAPGEAGEPRSARRSEDDARGLRHDNAGGPDTSDRAVGVGRQASLQGLDAAQNRRRDLGHDCRSHNNNNRLDTRSIQDWIDQTIVPHARATSGE